VIGNGTEKGGAGFLGKREKPKRKGVISEVRRGNAEKVTKKKGRE